MNISDDKGTIHYIYEEYSCIEKVIVDFETTSTRRHEERVRERDETLTQFE